MEKIAVGDLSDIREDENGDSRDWGASGNKKLHGCARGQSLMEHYKITADGRLFKEDAEYEHVHEAERPRYDEEIDGFEDEFERLAGSWRKRHQGWSDTEYHGVFEFHKTIDDDRLDRYSGYERATALFNEQPGEEDEDAWRDHAPTDPHPSVEDEQ